MNSPVIHGKEENTFSISWNYMFESSTVTAYFAFCYPYSYETIIAYMNNCDFRQYNGDYSSMDLYYNRELLIYTPERRRIDLLTVFKYIIVIFEIFNMNRYHQVMIKL